MCNSWPRHGDAAWSLCCHKFSEVGVVCLGLYNLGERSYRLAGVRAVTARWCESSITWKLETSSGLCARRATPLGGTGATLASGIELLFCLYGEDRLEFEKTGRGFVLWLLIMLSGQTVQMLFTPALTGVLDQIFVHKSHVFLTTVREMKEICGKTVCVCVCVCVWVRACVVVCVCVC